MRKQTGKTKPRPKRDQEWFRQKVAELGRALEKLPADRQEEFRRKSERESGKR